MARRKVLRRLRTHKDSDIAIGQRPQGDWPATAAVLCMDSKDVCEPCEVDRWCEAELQEVFMAVGDLALIAVACAALITSSWPRPPTRVVMLKLSLLLQRVVQHKRSVSLSATFMYYLVEMLAQHTASRSYPAPSVLRAIFARGSYVLEGCGGGV